VLADTEIELSIPAGGLRMPWHALEWRSDGEMVEGERTPGPLRDIFLPRISVVLPKTVRDGIR
jgi:hypothetical protein